MASRMGPKASTWTCHDVLGKVLLLRPRSRLLPFIHMSQSWPYGSRETCQCEGEGAKEGLGLPQSAATLRSNESDAMTSLPSPDSISSSQTALLTAAVVIPTWRDAPALRSQTSGPLLLCRLANDAGSCCSAARRTMPAAVARPYMQCLGIS